MSPASKGFTELACQPLGYGRGHVQSRGNCNKLVGWRTHTKKVKSHIVNHHLFLVTIFCANEIILKVPPTTSAANKMASYYQGQNIAWWDERSYCLTRTERFKWHHCTCCTCFTFQTLYCSMSRVFVYRKAEIGVLTNWRLAPLCCWKM